LANTLLTPTAVTREALRILHQKLNFVSTIDRQYDDQFAKTGAKIGDSLKIRLPNKYTVGTGATITPQDTTESSVTLQVATQKHVPIQFSSAEQTMSLDDFSSRILEPAMSVLAANIEYDVMSNVYKDVYNSVWNGGSAATLAKVATGRTMLQKALAPTNDRYANLNPQDMQDIITSGATLFNPGSEISKQYREGFVGRQGGFDYLENSMWSAHTRGDAASYVCNTSTGITSGSNTVTLSGGTGTIKQGDVFTIAGVFAVHPETRVSTGVLQQFVALADGTTSVTVAPTPITSGATQTVSIVGAGASKAVSVFGSASTAVGTSLAYQKGAFVFATADLYLPKDTDFAARETFDGISMRVARQWDVTTDKLVTRLDVLYGFKTVRPELAVRLHNN